jgi:hypothetical protein
MEIFNILENLFNPTFNFFGFLSWILFLAY